MLHSLIICLVRARPPDLDCLVLSRVSFSFHGKNKEKNMIIYTAPLNLSFHENN